MSYSVCNIFHSFPKHHVTPGLFFSNRFISKCLWGQQSTGMLNIQACTQQHLHILAHTHAHTQIDTSHGWQ